MKPFTYPYIVDQNRAHLKMDALIKDDHGAYRTGKITLDNGRTMNLLLRHSAATTALTYLQKTQINNDYRRLLNLPEAVENKTVELPAQLIVGAQRATLLAQGILDVMHTPDLNTTLKQTPAEKLAVIPIAREGTQFGLSNNLRTTCGYACPELPLTVRKSDKSEQFALSFQDQTITEAQRERMPLALLGGNLYNGQAHISMLDFMQQRFKRLTHVELLAPQASLQGLTRLLALSGPGLTLRAHMFETLLNHDTHFPHPEFHMRPSRSKRYRAWWGRDPQGFAIATLPCMGPDSAMPLTDPVRQIRTLNALLKERHRVTLSDVLHHNIFPPTITMANPVF